MLLFCCGTYYELLNAINIKLSLYADHDADLILMDSTNFRNQIEALKELTIFDEIIFIEGAWERDRIYKSASAEQRYEMNKFPQRIVGADLPNKKYSHYFMGAQTPFFKFVYYALIKKRIFPTPYLFEDGLYSYVLDYVNDCQTDGIDHESYGENSLMSKTAGIYLYGAELMYCGSEEIAALRIPRINCSEPSVVKLYQDVFGTSTLPGEKYIYLEEGMFQDKLHSPDLQLLDMISALVGKENIIVKRHPRCTIDRFTPRGYKVMENNSFPWEIALMCNNCDDKVLLTISSTASITASLVLGKETNVIQLFMMRSYGFAGPHIDVESYEELHKKMCKYLNAEYNCFHVPTSSRELEQILMHINRRRV